MNHERLEHLIEILKDVEEEKKPFNMNTWKYCAFGYAARDTVFNEQGLRLKSRPVYPIYVLADGSQFTGPYAGEKFFDINYADSIKIFHPYAYNIIFDKITPGDVIERIQQILKDSHSFVDDE